MLSFYAKRSEGEGFQRTTRPQEYTSWVHGSAITPEDINQLIQRYNLSANITRDVLDENELPRVEYSHSGNLYVFLRVPRISKRGEAYAQPLLMIAKDGRFFSLGYGSVFQPEDISQHETNRTVTPVQLLLLTFASVVNEYEKLVHRTSRSIMGISGRLKNHEVTNRDFLQFVTIEDNLNEYITNLDGMQVLARRLHDNSRQIFSAQDTEMIDDILLHIQQLSVSVASQRQSVTSIREAHSTIANNNLNHRVGLLTAITVLITIPNVFFGMYGMNVALPFAGEPWAYASIVVFTILLIFGVYLLARRFRMF